MADLETIERMHYFNTQFLVAEDFIAEQHYHRQTRYRYQREILSTGVVGGFEALKDVDPLIKVTAGMAVDGMGREIILLEDRLLNLTDIDGYDADGTNFLYVKFEEQLAGQMSMVEGEEQWTRRLEVPGWVLKPSISSGSDVEVLLAEIRPPDSSSTSEILEIEDMRVFASLQIPDHSIGEEKIAPGSVTVEKLAEGFELSTAELADGAVNAAKIKNLSVGTAELADGAVNAAKIKNLSVGTAELADGAVNAAKIKNLSVGTAELADGAVNAAKIKDDAVTKDKIGPNAVNNTGLDDRAVSLSKLNAPILADGSVTISSNREHRVQVTDELSTIRYWPKSLLVYTYSTTPGANFEWKEASETVGQGGVRQTLRIKQSIVFTNRSSKSIDVIYKVYGLL